MWNWMFANHFYCIYLILLTLHTVHACHCRLQGRGRSLEVWHQSFFGCLNKSTLAAFSRKGGFATNVFSGNAGEHKVAYLCVSVNHVFVEMPLKKKNFWIAKVTKRHFAFLLSGCKHRAKLLFGTPGGVSDSESCDRQLHWSQRPRTTSFLLFSLHGSSLSLCFSSVCCHGRVWDSRNTSFSVEGGNNRRRRAYQLQPPAVAGGGGRGKMTGRNEWRNGRMRCWRRRKRQVPYWFSSDF